MDMIYDIFLGEEPVGKAKVEIQGLYYRFDCVCHIAKGKLCRLAVSCGDKTESLGVCVPKGNAFGLSTCLPIKRLGRGALSFRAAVDGDRSEVGFIPIYADKPFLYISKLENAFLDFAGGNYGIRVDER